MTLSLRGVGAVTSPEIVALSQTPSTGTISSSQCRQQTFCNLYVNTGCYGPGYFTDFCTQWRAGIDPTPSVKPPVIDTTPGSPTYGQAMVDGRVVDTPADAEHMLDEQTLAQMRDWQSQNQASMDWIGTDAFGVAGSVIPDSNPFSDIDWHTVMLVAAGIGAVLLMGVLKR